MAGVSIAVYADVAGIADTRPQTRVEVGGNLSRTIIIKGFLMIASAIKSFSGLALVLFMLSPAWSATQENQAVIYIVGRIVEDPCDISPGQQAVQVSCFKDGKIQHHSVSYHAATGGTPVDVAGADISMRYLNAERKLAIVQVDYR